MIETKDLMHGNKVYWYDPQEKRDVIVSLTHRDILLMNGRESGFKPVPLSHGWLRRCGFIQEEDWFTHKDLEPFFIAETAGVFYLQHRVLEQYEQPLSGRRRLITSLHELQNLFYWQCGEPLTIQTAKKEEKANKYATHV